MNAGWYILIFYAVVAIGEIIGFLWFMSTPKRPG